MFDRSSPLRAAGHDAAVCTAEGFRSLVVGAGVDYVHMGNEMLDLVQSEMPRMGGVSDALRLVSRMSAAMRSALLDHWQAACEFRPSLLVYHPKMLGGLHIAERLQVPAVASLPLPFLTPTRAFPIPFIAHWPFGGSANKLSYQFNRFTAVAYGGMINSFRRKTLGLSAMNRWSDYLRFPDGRPVPVLYGFSPHVVPIPDDYPARMSPATGSSMSPRHGIRRLSLWTSSRPGKPRYTSGSAAWDLASMPGGGVRSWPALSRRPDSAPSSRPAGAVSKLARCPTVCMSSNRSRTPGFPQTVGVVHHGGAGTTAAGLLAARPTLVCPALGDQGFWAQRVHDLGVGPAPLPVGRLSVDELADRLMILGREASYRRRAWAISEELWLEDGVTNAAGILEQMSSTNAW